VLIYHHACEKSRLLTDELTVYSYFSPKSFAPLPESAQAGAPVHNIGSVAVIVNSALLLTWRGKK
jgi:hypothetical protein